MSTSEGEKTEESKNESAEERIPTPVNETAETETSSGLNGDTEMDVDENSLEDSKDPEDIVEENKVENESEDDPAPPKKRKFNDSGELSDDSSSTEFLGFPDTRTEEEKKAAAFAAAAKKEKEEKVKLDLLTFDAQAFGKGKRSRVPNKRYQGLSSTIRFSKSSHRHSEHLDNDSGHEDRNFDENDDEVSSSHSSPRAKSRVPASPATPSHTQKKAKVVDMTNPNFLKPFELGWKRELVYRATMDNNMRRNGDIYYYTPTGKKMRSMRELTDTLRIDKITEVTVDDFTFFKEPVGINDPEKEIIREAKYKKNSSLLKSGLGKAKTPSKNSSPKVAALNESSSKNTKSPRLGGFKVKITGSSKLNQGSNKKDNKRASADNDLEIGMLPPAWSPKKGSSAKQSNYLKTGSLAGSPLDAKPCRPCSIRCQGVSGIIPTLQCRLCLCLYHKECVGELTDDVPGGYVCKNCQLDNQDKIESAFEPAPPIGPPPLTPISSLKSNNTQSATPPKLQRIPRPGEKAFIPLPTQHVPKLNTIPEPLKSHLVKYPPTLYNLAAQTEPSKSIVGSVTTWFPPNSTLKMNASNSQNKNSTDILTTKPQNVVFMGERKFLVVPKGNVLSISPTLGAAVNTPSAKRVTSPTADKAPVFDGKEIGGNKTVEGASSFEPVQKNSVPANESPLSSLTSVLHPSDKPSLSATIDRPTIPVSSDLLVVREEISSATGETLKENQIEATTPKTRRGGASKKTPIVSTPIIKNDAETRFMQNYLQNLSYGYQTLLYVFQYLKVQDLLRAGCVCTLWRDIAGHPSLWNTVRMKNSQVANWEGLADALKKHRTKNLDLRKMLLPNTGDDMWAQFSKAIARVDSLVRIELCRCPASVIEQLATTNKSLQVINAVMIRCESMDISALDNLENLQELRLKSTNGFVLTSDLTPLKTLTKLKHLSLTSIKDLHKQNVQVIGDLISLETLDLGECSDFPDNFGTDVITKLTKLEKLRLEKGQGSCCTFNILDAVSKIPCLEQLELVNFDVKAGFDKSLGACVNIKKLLIIPTYISQSATTNHMVLGGVIKLKSTLSHFVWGVTLELLRVTELFVDQCEDSPNKDKKKPTGNGDSIPVLKPVPIMKTDESKEESSSKEQPQVEILPLPTLQKLLLNCLPTTRVKILKIPFHATWRQSIVDTVN